MKHPNTRFVKFKAALWREIGTHCVLLDDGETVLIKANEFSSPQSFRSLQAAIDHYAHLNIEQFNSI